MLHSWHGVAKFDITLIQYIYHSLLFCDLWMISAIMLIITYQKWAIRGYKKVGDS